LREFRFWVILQKVINSGGGEMLKTLVAEIAKALVDSPDKVEVREVEGDHTTVIELSVAKEDLGKVIGKEGRIAQATRTLLNAAAAKLKKRVVLEIIE